MNKRHFFPFTAIASLLSFASCISGIVNHGLDKAFSEPVDSTGYKSRELADTAFNRVDCQSYAIVTFHQIAEGQPPRVSLRARPDILQRYEIFVHDSTLTIKTEENKRLKFEDIALIDIYAPRIRRFKMEGLEYLKLGNFASTEPLKISIDGAGKLEARSLKAAALSLSLNGAGNVEIDELETDEVQAELNGAGHMRFCGTCQGGRFSIDGAGNIDISELHSSRAFIKEVSGTGNIKD